MQGLSCVGGRWLPPVFWLLLLVWESEQLHCSSLHSSASCNSLWNWSTLAVVFRPLPLLVATSPHWMEAAHLLSPASPRRLSAYFLQSRGETLGVWTPVEQVENRRGAVGMVGGLAGICPAPKSFFVVLEVVKVIRGHSGCPDQAGRPPVRRGRVG